MRVHSWRPGGCWEAGTLCHHGGKFKRGWKCLLSSKEKQTQFCWYILQQSECLFYSSYKSVRLGSALYRIERNMIYIYFLKWYLLLILCDRVFCTNHCQKKRSLHFTAWRLRLLTGSLTHSSCANCWRCLRFERRRLSTAIFTSLHRCSTGLRFGLMEMFFSAVLF